MVGRVFSGVRETVRDTDAVALPAKTIWIRHVNCLFPRLQCIKLAKPWGLEFSKISPGTGFE